jgi:tetratricopeptide (TPR) repeat protein
MYLKYFFIIPFFIGLILHQPIAKADLEWSKWQEAKKDYDSHRYQEALEELQKNPLDKSNYYYNLGLVYFRLGKLGPSLGYLEKANRLKQNDPDIQYNLSIARFELERAIGTEKLDPASHWIEQFADQIPTDQLRIILSLLTLISLLLWTKAYMMTRHVRSTCSQPAGFFGMLGLTLAIGVYGLQRWAHSQPPAICLEPLTVRSGPGNHFMELTRMEAGSKLRLLGPSVSSDDHENSSTETWKQVRYAPTEIGWAKASTLLPL